MKTIAVEVTAEHIREGYASTRKGPIVLAITPHVPPGTWIAHCSDEDGVEDVTYFLPRGGFTSSVLPESVVEFGRQLEASKHGPVPVPGPFSFQLSVPDASDTEVAA